MSSLPPSKDEENPYAAPRAEILGGKPAGEGTQTEAEEIRRRYINHEASVKSIGSLHLLGAIIATIALVIVAAGMFRSGRGANVEGEQIGMLVGIGIYAMLNYALGIGLTRLQPWARWTDIVLLGLSMTVNLGMALFMVVAGGAGPMESLVTVVIGLAIPTYILYLLLSSRGAMVCSAEYRAIIEKTPHIKYKTSCLVKGALGIFLAVILLVFITALIMNMSRW